MKFLASGDHHFFEHLRFDECISVHHWMVDLARREKVDAFLSGGDVYERASTPRERLAVAEWLTAMAEVCPVVISKGNHDRPLDAELMARLETDHPVIVESTARVHRVAGASIAAVAWPDRASLAASLGRSAASDEIDLVAQDALRTVLLALGHEMDQHEGPRILLGHFMCDGAKVSTGQPLLGMPLRVGLSDLALARPHLCLMSHIHLSQRWELAGIPYRYMGSPFRTDFGQLEPKTVLLATFDGDTLVEELEVETPCARMVHVAGEFCWENYHDRADFRSFIAHDLEGSPAGAEIRLRYAFEVDRRADAAAVAAQLKAEWLAAGAVSVKVEEEAIAKSDARAPEVAKAKTLAEKLGALWTARGTEPAPERRDALLGKLTELEQADQENAA